MAAGTWVPCCLIVCLLVCSSGAQENIPAELGQDVILPCKAPNINNNIIRAVEWNRPVLDPEYVLLYRDGRLHPDHQHPSYQNRVDLQDKDMKDGNFSLILKNLTKNDTGTYVCRVFEKGKIELICSIILEVLPPGREGGNTGDEGNKTGVNAGSVVGGIFFLAVLASVGFLVYRRLRRQNPDLPVPPDEAAV